MHAFSLEIMIDGSSHTTKLFTAIRRFDATVVMGTVLKRLRDRTPFTIELDTPKRAQILGRLLVLIDEIEGMGAAYDITANNVPKTSHLWKPVTWGRSEIETALAEAKRKTRERERTAVSVTNSEPPTPSPARQLFDYRWSEMSFDSLLPEEQRYIHIWALQAEVYNGGFATFFYNSSGDTAAETLFALKYIGAPEIAKILESALAMFDDVGGYSSNRKTRVERLNQLADDCFTETNTKFHEATEDIALTAFNLVEAAYRNRSML